jgi:hypothetical protein
MHRNVIGETPNLSFRAILNSAETSRVQGLSHHFLKAEAERPTSQGLAVT